MNVEKELHKLVAWICSTDFWLCISKLGFALFATIGMFFWQQGKGFVTVCCAMLWIISGFSNHILGNRKEKQYIQIQTDNKNLHTENKNLQERYDSLLRLMDTLFNAQMTSLHDEISLYVGGYVRTSVYMYDSTKFNFRCFARHSKHTLFCKKNKKDEYPNKGWLQSTWNQQNYHFECDYTNVDMWVQRCKEECKNNCYNTQCHNTSCVYGKKERLPKNNCCMLSKNELYTKNMKAKTVLGQVLSQGGSPLGIILVESMDIWDAQTFKKIKELVLKYSNSSLEILSLHGKQLLELLNTTDSQKDMAEEFTIGGRKYAK